MMNKNCLPHIVTAVSLAVFIILVSSCASTPAQQPPTPSNPYRPISEFPNANVIGLVQTNLTWPNAIVSDINERAYYALLETAKKEHSGIIDIVDISWVIIRGGLFFQFTAIGKVVTLDGSRATAAGVEGALERAAEQTLRNVPQRSRIAIVYITAQDRSTTDYIAGELEYIWVNGGYIITDRSQLDRLRLEQNFQLSGEVDDATAVSIGRFAGADIIVTGRVDGEGNLRRLRLRAIDTQSVQVVGAASEPL
jgi:hypothetical protein